MSENHEVTWSCATKSTKKSGVHARRLQTAAQEGRIPTAARAARFSTKKHPDAQSERTEGAHDTHKTKYRFRQRGSGTMLPRMIQQFKNRDRHELKNEFRRNCTE